MIQKWKKVDMQARVLLFSSHRIVDDGGKKGKSGLLGFYFTLISICIFLNS